MGMRNRRHALLFALIIGVCLLFTSCGGGNPPQDPNGLTAPSAKETLHILSGSENKELEPILAKFVQANNISVDMTYMGSLDIMRALSAGASGYDAVWPASSLWLSLGDTGHKVKYAQSTSLTPVVFGVKKSLAEKLGFTGREVSIKDILGAITAGDLTFCMTSATQSNSGASAYLGFLYALLGNPDVITSEDLDNAPLRQQIQELLSGVDRSSGSSDWLKELFLKSDYDAMVNYEALVIAANKELVKAGKEPLYVVYPYDGLSLADSPLGYVEAGSAKKEEAFLALQSFLLSDQIQDEIQRTGRRTGYTGVLEKNKDVFSPDWGVQADRVLSPFKYPNSEVIIKALNLYQTEFRKPSLSVYCLDFSGSMEGEGNRQLVAALEQIFLQQNAEKNFLQANEADENIAIIFSGSVTDTYTAGGDAPGLESLYSAIGRLKPGGGTDIYAAASKALELLKGYDLSKYTPAVILMTDGRSQGGLRESGFENTYRQSGLTVPVFSIMFGDADSGQLDQLAELTTARVFDGRQDLIGAFRTVKGYN